MKEYRINLDDRIDADLIDRISTKANGGAQNTALRFLVRYWFENETHRKTPETRRKHAGNTPDIDTISTKIEPAPQDLDDQIEAAVASIDGEW